MKIFISWSGPTSHQLARIMHEWLPDIMQQVEPWLSSEDIGKGSRWSAEIGTILDGTSQGIICVTRENMASPWLNFEAGALARSLQESKVRPVLLDLRPADLTGPLSQFQLTNVRDENDMLRFMKSINVECARPLDDVRLGRAFAHYWKDFVNRLEAIPVAAPQTAVRDEGDVLREVLDIVRKLDRRNAFVVPTQPRQAMPRWGVAEPSETITEQ